MLRPKQWLKNMMLFLPLFLSGQLFVPGVFEMGLMPFLAFCMVSSSGYIINDIFDRTRDLLHPEKRFRAIPSGAVNLALAKLYAIFLSVAGLYIASQSSSFFIILLCTYFVVSTLYSLGLKNYPLVDLFCISLGFLLRLQAGGEVFNIIISPWLFLTVLLLAVFLSSGKRLSELTSMGEFAGEHRISISGYPQGFLFGIMIMTGSSVLVTFAIYSLNKSKLFYSVPICLFGLLRYLYRVSKGQNGDPTDSLCKDQILLSISLIWLMIVVWSIYY
jgi:decaprenyl-phosphate phosphoribosyltransferase